MSIYVILGLLVFDFGCLKYTIKYVYYYTYLTYSFYILSILPKSVASFLRAFFPP